MSNEEDISEKPPPLSDPYLSKTLYFFNKPPDRQ